MGILPPRSKRSETAFFLRQALTDFGIKMYDKNEGIQLANRFISYLEVLRALGTLPAHFQAVMIAYYREDATHEMVAEKFHMSVVTLQRWLREGLDLMAEIIWR